jgi:hypothetical protein
MGPLIVFMHLFQYYQRGAIVSINFCNFQSCFNFNTLFYFEIYFEVYYENCNLKYQKLYHFDNNFF